MSKQSEETKLKRRKPANRRGVFTTWGSDTWQALLAKSKTGVTDALENCSAVGAVERGVTKSVLDGSWDPPSGDWMLVVAMDAQGWVTLVCSGWPGDVLEKLASQFDGQLLVAGHSDCAGTVYARVTESDPNAPEGVTVRFDFQSDGTPWDDDEDDEFDEDEDDDDEEEDELDEIEQAIADLTVTRIVSDDLESNWLEQFDSLPDAHQAVFRHLDAYIPGLYYDLDESQLTAPFGHDDILPHVTSIDLVRIGTVPKDEPSPKILKLTRKLHEAIGSGVVDEVKAAIAEGALLEPTDGDASALYLACFDLAYSPYKPRVEIIKLLLEAGADPNDNRRNAENGYADTPLSRLIQASRPPFDIAGPIARNLVEAGADLNPQSPYPLQLGERPLHHAAKKALLDWVKLLLELGADPMAKSDAGRTPRESVEDLIAAKEASDFYSAADIEQEREDYKPILELLAAAEQKQ
ncbi:ankyrin repeat domain-containing protein [Aporhodopirellula aestuarii]|uniref:Ankyrin repeats (3 copies) n=1 Tax=Aporhodopirellula aestuarii TaxID=2950107 RepID=A0ABT0UEX8_9BACT|nr:ankyrin repeat domain-containing protein [Aporhodopirellula aestuarii]MCM2374950.1 hypothetical protein [Aporhodopirellula aestuarii]